ncbi:hypothetical protein RISK_005630 [Rhodopirellula islandica]|uniref:Uncharacterized protein n=1 Tax=Rhodopirellula islandica TaxID=595434 RepID=A0A0J1EAH3_RHOIS|nr:hypothetical protein RISK_005630 [Rhodopirellula islandica]
MAGFGHVGSLNSHCSQLLTKGHRKFESQNLLDGTRIRQGLFGKRL